MPFLARCPFCGKKARVPDDWLGTSLTCPKCNNGYTVSPWEESDPPIKKLKHDVAAPAAPEEPHSLGAQAPVEMEKMSAPLLPGLNTWFALAMFLAGIAVFVASFRGLHRFTIPLALVGVLLASLGWITSAKKEGLQLVWAVLSIGLNMAVLGIIYLSPGLLGPAWAAQGPPRQTGTVKGKVSLQGKTVTQGKVIIAGSDEVLQEGLIQEDGSYVVAGLALGTARIFVVGPDPKRDHKKSEAQRKVFEEKTGMTRKTSGSSIALNGPAIPAEYGNLLKPSGLTVEVSKGTITHNIELTIKEPEPKKK